MFVCNAERKGWLWLWCMLNLLLALGRLNRGGGSACCPPALCPLVSGTSELGGEWEEPPHTPPHSYIPACRLTTLRVFLSLCLPRPDQKKQVSLSLLFSVSPFLPPFLFIISFLKLFLWVFQSLLFLSPFLPPSSWHLLSIQWHLPPQSIPSPANEHTWAHIHFTFYTVFLLYPDPTIVLQLLVFSTITCCTGLVPRSNRLYHLGLLSDTWLHFCS